MKNLFLFSLFLCSVAKATEPENKAFGSNYAAAADYAGQAFIKQYDLEVYFKSLENRAVYMMQVYTPLNPKYAAGFLVLADSALIQKKFEANLGSMPIRNLSCTSTWYLESQQLMIGFRYKF